ncbi:MAG: hypothetical protein RLZZ106_1357 [Cyanobacteriota bacterium]
MSEHSERPHNWPMPDEDNDERLREARAARSTGELFLVAFGRRPPDPQPRMEWPEPPSWPLAYSLEEGEP